MCKIGMNILIQILDILLAVLTLIHKEQFVSNKDSIWVLLCNGIQDF